MKAAAAVTGIILQGLVPTEAMKAGDFNGSGKTVRDPLNNNMPFPGNVIPRNRFDRIANEMLQYFPAANFIGVRPGVNFLQTPSDTRAPRPVHSANRSSAFDKGHPLRPVHDGRQRAAQCRVHRGKRSDSTGQHASPGDRLYAPVLPESDRRDTPRIHSRFSGATKRRRSLPRRIMRRNLASRTLAANPGDYTLPSVSLTRIRPGNPTGTAGFVGYGLRIVQNNLYYRAGRDRSPRCGTATPSRSAATSAV